MRPCRDCIGKVLPPPVTTRLEAIAEEPPWCDITNCFTKYSYFVFTDEMVEFVMIVGDR